MAIAAKRSPGQALEIWIDQVNRSIPCRATASVGVCQPLGDIFVFGHARIMEADCGQSDWLARHSARRVETVTVLAFLLGVIHGYIGCLHQLSRCSSIDREQGNPE